ncbi:hypothetical protein BKI52_30380 [marine bacterium AO1-C]|nr:hypothetical protein BKI52_30380 [marine bacterium AO1-C]
MFHFEKDYIISNTIAELSPLQDAHESALFEASNNEEIWTHFTENGYGKANFSAYIKRALQQRERNNQYPFVIKDLRTNKLAGITRLYDIDNHLQNVKIGHTWIGKQFQGTGLNKACKFLLFEFLFEEIKMERIGFGASAENTKSIQAMESVGCVQEGRLRSFLPKEGSTQRIDIVLLSLLKNEWEQQVKAALAQKLKQYTG